MSTSSNSEQPRRSSRWKNACKNLALFAGMFLFCAAAAEIVLRCMGYGNLEIYQPDSRVYWRLKPNQNCFTKIDHKPVHINSHGTRGAEFTAAKPPQTIRILSLGDSRTFGWGLTEAETYSALLQKHLQEQVGPAKKIEVINAGVNAWGYPQMATFFRESGLAWQPDFVIVAEGNLSTQFSEKADPRFVKQMASRVRLKNFLRRFALYHFVVEVKLRGIYEVQRAKFIPVDPAQDKMFKEQQQKDPDAVFRNAMQDVCSVALSNHVQPVLLYIPAEFQLGAPTSTNAFGNIRRVKTDLHLQRNIPLLDLTADFAPRAKDLYLEGDPIHPNASGNEIMGRRLFETVGPLLKP